MLNNFVTEMENMASHNFQNMNKVKHEILSQSTAKHPQEMPNDVQNIMYCGRLFMENNSFNKKCLLKKNRHFVHYLVA